MSQQKSASAGWSRLIRSGALLPSAVAAAAAVGLLAAWLLNGATSSAALAPHPIVSMAPEPVAPAPMSVPAPEPEGVASPPEPEPELRVAQGTVEAGSTLSGALAEHDVPPGLTDRIAREMRPVFDFRRAREGHRFRLVHTPEGELVSFDYRVSPLERYRLTPGEEDAWLAEREEVPLERRRARLAGLVTSSLYDSIQQLGESPQLAHDVAGIFAWDVDFTHGVQPGDEFRVVYERLYLVEDGEEIYVGPGRVLAARYRGNTGEYTAVYYEPEEGRGGYYRPDGTSVERQFLAAPVSYTRISSRYSPARFHPILGVWRPHHGIDYAAPWGTPVWSVANGKVIHKGWAGGFGRLVKVRHANGYVSYYAHLSRFANGIALGSVVQQKQVIGYVGSSGLATGPHVCYRMTRGGRYVNPTSLRVPAGEPIVAQRRVEFEQVRNDLLATLSPPRLVATDEAL